MTKLWRVLATLVLATGVLMPASASAADILHDPCNNAPGSALCADRGTKDNPLTGSNGLLIKITRIVAFVAGAAAVIIIMLSGLRYINSGGDATKATQARNGIIYALAGLIVIIAAQYIISLVISRI